MKLIVNTTNLRMGGALQVSCSLLDEFRHHAEHEYHVFLSKELNALINTKEYPGNFHFYQFTESPTASLRLALTFHNRLSALEQKIRPDFVFTVFGPALWRPRAPHLIGFANVILFDDAPYTRRILLATITGKIKYHIRRALTLRQFRKDADIFWLETEFAKRKLVKSIGLKEDQVKVISNNYGRSFENYVAPAARSKKHFGFLYLTAYYPHKNLEILNALIPLLKKKNIDCVFYLTLKPEDFGRVFPSFQNDEMLQNLGPLKPEECPAAYAMADAVFCPTFLEFFTAAYPEAMIMERPILTSDLDFAHDICRDAAWYFDPFDPQAASGAIEKLIYDPALRQALVENGKKRVLEFDTASQRAENLLNMMKDYLLRHR